MFGEVLSPSLPHRDTMSCMRAPGTKTRVTKRYSRGLYRENRILITLDKDFGELAIVRNRPHSGIVRLVGVAARRQGIVCATVVQQYGTLLAAGAIVTVEATRVRVRVATE